MFNMLPLQLIEDAMGSYSPRRFSSITTTTSSTTMTTTVSPFLSTLSRRHLTTMSVGSRFTFDMNSPICNMTPFKTFLSPPQYSPPTSSAGSTPPPPDDPPQHSDKENVEPGERFNCHAHKRSFTGGYIQCRSYESVPNTLIRRESCGLKYCDKCLTTLTKRVVPQVIEREYGSWAAYIEKGRSGEGEWQCMRCLDVCTCAGCRHKKRKWRALERENERFVETVFADLKQDNGKIGGQSPGKPMLQRGENNPNDLRHMIAERERALRGYEEELVRRRGELDEMRVKQQKLQGDLAELGVVIVKEDGMRSGCIAAEVGSMRCHLESRGKCKEYVQPCDCGATCTCPKQECVHEVVEVYPFFCVKCGERPFA